MDFLFLGKQLFFFYNPGSKYNSDSRKGTHLGVYVGKEKIGKVGGSELFFAEQVGLDQRIRGFRWNFNENGLYPLSVINPKNELNDIIENKTPSGILILKPESIWSFL